MIVENSFFSKFIMFSLYCFTLNGFFQMADYFIGTILACAMNYPKRQPGPKTGPQPQSLYGLIRDQLQQLQLASLWID